MLRLFDWLPWIVPGVYGGGAVLAAGLGSRAWRVAGAAARGALLAALLGCGVSLYAATPVPGGAGSAAPQVVTVLIAFLGWIIGDYAARYLRGEPGQTRFVVAFLGTLAAVSAVVASANLPTLVAAWAASSAGLHHLLTFYRERPAAVIVAHKKFLASRLAEVCLVLACILLYREWGTLDLAQIGARAAGAATLSWSASVAAGLIAVAVLLKCAQLPLHGWLIQVMEAPTPVSALLHAGVVNLGGFVLIRLAPLISASPLAQTLLVLVGSLTAALAGLVMLTRITIKVRLAWSTCSQMGLMVMECGLGLYDLALLHLLAHALYKAHAFLTAGEAVREGLARQLVAGDGGGRRPMSSRMPVVALVIAAATVILSALAWRPLLAGAAPSPVALTLFACGLAMLLWSPGRGLASGTCGAIGATQLYLAWHWLLAAKLGLPHAAPAPLLAAWAVAVFLALYAAQVAVRRIAGSGSRRAIYDWVYAGFYLDERFTRLTFRLWPPRRAATPARHDRRSNAASAEGLA